MYGLAFGESDLISPVNYPTLTFVGKYKFKTHKQVGNVSGTVKDVFCAEIPKTSSPPALFVSAQNGSQIAHFCVLDAGNKYQVMLFSARKFGIIPKSANLWVYVFHNVAGNSDYGLELYNDQGVKTFNSSDIQCQVEVVIKVPPLAKDNSFTWNGKSGRKYAYCVLGIRGAKRNYTGWGMDNKGNNVQVPYQDVFLDHITATPTSLKVTHSKAWTSQLKYSGGSKWDAKIVDITKDKLYITAVDITDID